MINNDYSIERFKHDKPQIINAETTALKYSPI